MSFWSKNRYPYLCTHAVLRRTSKVLGVYASGHHYRVPSVRSFLRSFAHLCRHAAKPFQRLCRRRPVLLCTARPGFASVSLFIKYETIVYFSKENREMTIVRGSMLTLIRDEYYRRDALMFVWGSFPHVRGSVPYPNTGLNITKSATWYPVTIFFFTHIYLPAFGQAVVTWSQRCSPFSPPCACLHFLSRIDRVQQIPLLVDFLSSA